MRRITITLILILLQISCTENKFKLPKQYNCTKITESDSIIDNYFLSKKNQTSQFSTIFGFKLCISKEINTKILNNKATKDPQGKYTLHINKRIRPLQVWFNEFNGKTYRIYFNSHKRNKHLQSDDVFAPAINKEDRRLNEEAENKNFYLKMYPEEEDLKYNFDNLLVSFTKKYGKYNFFENSDALSLNNNNNDIYKRYFWIIDNTLIVLKYTKMINTEEFKEDINQNVETSIEDIDIEYENITIKKLAEEDVLRIQNEEIDKRKRILQNKRKIIKDLDKNDQEEIIKNL
jgi:hypothetical protein